MERQIWFDRDKNSINGALTIQEVSDSKVVQYPLGRRLVARSGQNWYEHTSWVRSKSPIPYSSELRRGTQYWLYLNPINVGLKPGKTGIGESWPIGNTDDPDRIYGLNDGELRELVRLHADNAIPGSAGCIAVVSWETFMKIHNYLMSAKQEGVKKIPLYVV